MYVDSVAPRAEEPTSQNWRSSPCCVYKEGRISEDHVYARLGELITGAKKGRSSEREITLFKSVGLALQDAAAAAKTHQLAREKGIGTEVAF